MKSRVISGAIMVAILLPILYFGGIVYAIGVGLLATVAFKEMIDVKAECKIPPIMKVVGLICMLMLTYVNVDGKSILFGLSYETLSIVFLLLLAPTVFLSKKNYKIADAFYLSAVSIFLGTIFNLFIMLFNESKILFIMVIIIASATDIFALLGGMLIGRHKLTKISPKKTIEGAVVGTIISTIISTTYYMTLIGGPSLADGSLIRLIFIIIILSVMGQIGDLFFSLIKRENDVKDFSNLIPGHGGVLDRIDSIIFVLITFVFMMQYL